MIIRSETLEERTKSFLDKNYKRRNNYNGSKFETTGSENSDGYICN